LIVVLPAGILAALVLCVEQALGEETPSSDWHYGGTTDVSYAVDFNFPENHQWRSKTTTLRVNEPVLNMAMGYVRKGYDCAIPLGFGVRRPRRLR